MAWAIMWVLQTKVKWDTLLIWKLGQSTHSVTHLQIKVKERQIGWYSECILRFQILPQKYSYFKFCPITIIHI